MKELQHLKEMNDDSSQGNESSISQDLEQESEQCVNSVLAKVLCSIIIMMQCVLLCSVYSVMS